jgi:hypothetical protein
MDNLSAQQKLEYKLTHEPENESSILGKSSYPASTKQFKEFKELGLPLERYN